MSNSRRMLFDFGDAGARSGWRNIDDEVMGGVSNSNFVAVTENTVAFSGRVSLDHGGGFASVRSPTRTWNLTGFDGILLRARGDRKRYKLTLYTSTADSISYRFSFTTRSEWTDHFAPFDVLTPMRRGRNVPDAPVFDAASVTAVGLLIADKQAGPFRLELRWIQAAAAP